MIPANLTVQDLCQLIGYKELCNFSLGKQVEELTKQLAALRPTEESADAPDPSPQPSVDLDAVSVRDLHHQDAIPAGCGCHGVLPPV